MKDLVEVVGIHPYLEELGVSAEPEDFEATYDALLTSGVSPEKVRQLEGMIWDYFASLELPDIPTVYDYLLLTLRRKDIVATFNWDPFLAQAYRRNRNSAELPEVVFLHGNVEVAVCEQDKVKGWHDQICSKCRAPLEPAPLLFPIKDKNYRENHFIQSEWKVLQARLEGAYFLTIFGYSAPKTDAAARELLQSVWAENQTKELADVEIIDIIQPEELHDKWKEFIVGHHYFTGNNFLRSYQMQHPRRSCDALAGATLNLKPWAHDWMPEVVSIGELHDWIQPLVEEEAKYSEEGATFSGLPSSQRNMRTRSTSPNEREITAARSRRDACRPETRASQLEIFAGGCLLSAAVSLPAHSFHSASKSILNPGQRATAARRAERGR